MTMQLTPRTHLSAETMKELRALNARFIHNFVTNDVTSHDAILHSGFVNIWPTGQRWERATYLKYWATAFDPQVIVYWDVRDELITIIGNVALVRATNKHTRRRDGRNVTGVHRLRDQQAVLASVTGCAERRSGEVAEATAKGESARLKPCAASSDRARARFPSSDCAARSIRDRTGRGSDRT